MATYDLTSSLIGVTTTSDDVDLLVFVMAEQALTQSQRVQRGWVRPIILVDILIGSTYFRVSDRDFTYRYDTHTIHYEGYLLNIQGLGEFASTDGQGYNSQVILTLSDEAYGAYENLVLWNNTTPFIGCNLTIWELRIVEADEWFDSDVRTCIHKLCVQQVTNIRPDVSFDLICSSRLYAKRNAYGQDVVTKALYPYADPNHIGMPRNILYGELYNVPCRCVLAGAIDLLSSGITAASTTIPLSGIAQVDWTDAPLTILIDEEQIYCPTAASNNRFTGVTRGHNSTTATVHNKGAPVLDYVSSIIYEVARHPIKSIDYVRVLDVLQKVNPTAGYVVTAYTGATGDEHSDYPGRAILDFNLPLYIKKKVNQEIATEHTHDDNTSEGSHAHDTTALSMVTRYVTSVSGATGITNSANCYDYSTVTYAQMDASSTSTEMTLNFDSNGAGTLSTIKVFAVLRHSSGGSGNKLKISCQSNTLYESNQALVEDTNPVTLAWVLSTSTWPSSILMEITAGSGTSYNYHVYEVWVECYFTPTISAHAATGVSNVTSVDADSIMGGLTVADLVIGDEVTVDCHGYEDDGSGTYTGTPNSTIKRPDHVFKHILVALLGISSGDLGNNMLYNAARWFARRSFEFAFVMHDLGDSIDIILQNLGMQCGCSLIDWNGDLDLIPINVSPAVVYRWDFLDSDEGWTPTNASVAISGSVLTITPSSAGPFIAVENLEIPGAYYTQVAVRLKRSSGSSWDGHIYYKTSGHGFSASYYRAKAEPSGVDDGYVEQIWDMTALNAGADDWVDSSITALRIDLGSDDSTVYTVDWIEVRLSEDPLPHTRLNWGFVKSTCGWEGTNATLTTGNTYLTVTATADATYIYNDKSSCYFYGSRFTQVKARIKRTVGTGWGGKCYYKTGSHNYDEDYKKTVAEPSDLSDWTTVTWDMTDLTSGGNDWITSTITAVRIDLTATDTDVFLVDWIKIEPTTPPLVIESDMVLEVPTFSWSGSQDAITDLRGFYARDYRGTTGAGQVLMPDVPQDARARGYLDCIDVGHAPYDNGVGKINQEIDLKAIRAETMAREVLCQWGRKWGYPTLTMSMICKWEAMSSYPGSIIDYTCPVFGQKYYRIIEFRPDYAAGKVDLVAETWL